MMQRDDRDAIMPFLKGNACFLKVAFFRQYLAFLPFFDNMLLFFEFLAKQH
jgi:hypothetical protein